jgi:hypothetical protein
VKTVAITIIICASALAGAFLWMTPYRYDNGGMIRVHRITGRTEMFYTDTGWITPTKYAALQQEQARERERKREEAEDQRQRELAAAFLDRVEAEQQKQRKRAAIVWDRLEAKQPPLVEQPAPKPSTALPPYDLRNFPLPKH